MRLCEGLIWLAAVWVGGAGAARADALCKDIQDSKERLACYDRGEAPDSPDAAIASQKPAVKAPHFAAVQKTVGEWSVKIDDDQFTDENKIIVVETTGEGAFGLRCFSGKPSLAFLIGDVSAKTGDEFAFRFRVDKGSPWEAAGTALGETTIEADMPEGLLKEMLAGNRLAARIIEGAGTSADHSFSLAKLGAALKEFVQLCPP